MPALNSDGCTFVSAGREDIDVRMMGGGRPFVLEISNQRAAMPPQARARRSALLLSLLSSKKLTLETSRSAAAFDFAQAVFDSLAERLNASECGVGVRAFQPLTRCAAARPPKRAKPGA